MSIPTVFVSYSHDSQEHKKWVLDLATRLRNSGVDAILDQWELQPGDDLPHFMETHLLRSDYVLMICTKRYVDKANAGTGGVGYEKMIVTADLLSNIDSRKVIPIIKQAGTHDVPTFLRTKLFIDFSSDDEYEFNFDELVRVVHNSPLFEKPEIGNNPFESVEATRPRETHNALRALMGFVVANFEKGGDITTYGDLYAKMRVSRVYLDLLIKEAVDKDMLLRYEDGDVELLDGGKKYAFEQGLIDESKK